MCVIGDVCFYFQLEIKQKDARIAQLEVELSEAKRLVSRKDNEVSNLHREIHKIQVCSPALRHFVWCFWCFFVNGCERNSVGLRLSTVDVMLDIVI